MYYVKYCGNEVKQTCRLWIVDSYIVNLLKNVDH